MKSKRDELVKAGSGGPAGRSVVVVDSPGPKSVRVVAAARFVVARIKPVAKITTRPFGVSCCPPGSFNAEFLDFDLYYWREEMMATPDVGRLLRTLRTVNYHDYFNVKTILER